MAVGLHLLFILFGKLESAKITADTAFVQTAATTLPQGDNPGEINERILQLQ